MSSAENHTEISGTVSPEEIDNIEGEVVEARIRGNTEDHTEQISLENGEFHGTVEAPEEFNGMTYPPIQGVRNSEINGDISQRNFMRGAEKAIARGGHISSDELLNGAENSLILGDRVQNHQNTMGAESEASVVAATDLITGDTFWDHVAESFRSSRQDKRWLSALRPSRRDTAEVGDSLTVFTPEEHEADTTIYRGDWNDLTEYLEQTVPEGAFQPMEIFDLDEVGSVEELDQVLEELDQKYDEVKANFEKYEEARENLEASDIQGSNEERYRKLRDLNILDIDAEIGITAVEDPETSEVSVYLDAPGGSSRPVLDAEWDDFIEMVASYDLDDENLSQGFRIVGDIFGEENTPETLEELENKFEEYRIKGEELKDAYSVWRSLKDQMGHGYLPHDRDEREGELREFMEEWDIEKLQETIEEMDRYPVEPDLKPDEYERPDRVMDAVRRELRQEWGLSQDSLDRLDEAEKEDYVLSSMARLMRDGRKTRDSLIDKAWNFFRSVSSDDSMSEEERFVQEFAGGASEEYLLEPGFQQRYFTDGEEIVETDEEVRDSVYEEGTELLGRIARGQGELEVEDPEIQEMEEELDELIDQISSSQGRPDQELIERKNEIKSELPEKRRQKAFEDLGVEYNTDESYDHLEPYELGQVLDQLAQETLQGDESNPETAAGKAKSLSGPLTRRSNVGNGYVDFDVWDKDLQELPSDDRRVPCTFPGGSFDRQFINYMRDPGTQIAMLEAGEDEGAVISNLVEYQGEDMLLVHSVESDDGITSRNDISRAIRDHIEDYAEEAGMDGILYSTGTHNTAAQNFLEATVQNDPNYHERTYTVDKKGREDVHLDFELPEVEGYLERLD